MKYIQTLRIESDRIGTGTLLSADIVLFMCTYNRIFNSNFTRVDGKGCYSSLDLCQRSNCFIFRNSAKTHIFTRNYFLFTRKSYLNIKEETNIMLKYEEETPSILHENRMFVAQYDLSQSKPVSHSS